MDSAALLDLLGNENRRRILRLLARKPCYVTEISEYLGVSPKAVIDHLRKLEDAGLVESHVDDGRRKYFSIARNLRLEVNVSPYDFGTKSAYSASPNLDITAWRYVSLDLQRMATDEDEGEDAAEEPEEGTDGPATEVRADAVDDPADDPTAEDSTAEDPTAVPDGPAADSVAGGGTDLEDGDADRDEEAADDEGPGDADDLSALAADLQRLERLENELSMAQRWVQGRLIETLDRISGHFEGVDGRFYAELLRGLATGPATPRELSHRVEAPPDVVADALEGLSAHGVVEADGDQWRLA
jgi:ArsR family transcriptional regulator